MAHNVDRTLLDKISFENSQDTVIVSKVTWPLSGCGHYDPSNHNNIYLSNIVFISYMKCLLLGLQQVPIFASLYFLIPISGQPNNTVFSEPDYEESKNLA
jgi:hypothetical protein